MLRLPFFLAWVILQIVIGFPLELIIFKIVGSVILFVISVFGIVNAVLFSNKYQYEQHVDTIKEIGELFLDFEAFDISGAVHFLRYGSCP